MAATFSQLSDQGLRRTAGVVARAFGQTEDDVLMGRHGVLVTREADLLDRGIQIPSERAQLLRVQAQMTSSSDVGRRESASHHCQHTGDLATPEWQGSS